jgi:hypothetical protein
MAPCIGGTEAWKFEQADGHVAQHGGIFVSARLAPLLRAENPNFDQVRARGDRESQAARDLACLRADAMISSKLSSLQPLSRPS